MRVTSLCVYQVKRVVLYELSNDTSTKRYTYKKYVSLDTKDPFKTKVGLKLKNDE